MTGSGGSRLILGCHGNQRILRLKISIIIYNNKAENTIAHGRKTKESSGDLGRANSNSVGHMAVGGVPQPPPSPNKATRVTIHRFGFVSKVCNGIVVAAISGQSVEQHLDGLVDLAKDWHLVVSRKSKGMSRTTFKAQLQLLVCRSMVQSRNYNKAPTNRHLQAQSWSLQQI